MKIHKIGNLPVAQGDILMRRIDKLPDNVTEIQPENGKFVLAHSEAGHHHAVKAKKDVSFYQSANDNMVAYLVVNNTTCLVEHERSFHTHEPFEFDNGIFEIRRQIESDDTPQGWRRAID